MIQVKNYTPDNKEIDLKQFKQKAETAKEFINNRNGKGSDYIGWLDYASKLTKSEIEDIKNTASYIKKNFDVLVVCGIGGSYLGPRAVIEALKDYQTDGIEIIYMGNTLSTDETYDYLNYLADKKFAVNVISKSGTTTETAIAFRLLKDLLIKQGGIENLKKSIFATTDKENGALRSESNELGYKTFIIPNDIGGRYSVITPVGLLPIACAGIDIEKFLSGVIDGEKDYSVNDLEKNQAYKYAQLRYYYNTVTKKSAEMFVTYSPKFTLIGEWLKQLFDESEGKDGKGLLVTSSTFTTDLHSMGQFIQDGSHVLFETIIKPDKSKYTIKIPNSDNNLDNLNYLTDKTLDFVNDKAFSATLNAHLSGKTPCIVLSFEKMDEYNLGNLMYFFFRATALSAYMLDVNPFNQPGVEVYKKNMFTLLGKPGYKK